MSYLRTGIILALSVIACMASAEPEPAKKTAPPPPPVFAQVKDTAELLDAVSRITWQGGTISLLPGTYEIKDSIVIKSSNTYLIGSGWNTLIKKIGDGDAIVFSGSLWCCGVKNLVVEGDPNAKTGSGIVFKDGEWSGICVIDYCYLRSFPESGLRFDGNLKAPFSSNTVSNCWFQGNKGDQLSSRNNNDWYIIANQFGSGGEGARSAALLENSSAGTYTMNYHWGNRVGVRMLGGNFNRVENNRIEQSRESGLVIGDPTPGTWNAYNIITGNTIHTNSETNSGKFPAVVAYDAHETTFCTNQLMSWDSNSVRHKHGLVLERCRTWIIKDNIFRHHSEKAMVLNKKKDGHIIKDNIMDKDVDPKKAQKAKKVEKVVETEE
ncbi:MAG: right-handed parallel beta-helix repeat-containing protein [Armatimonadota bacterium]